MLLCCIPGLLQPSHNDGSSNGTRDGTQLWIRAWRRNWLVSLWWSDGKVYHEL